MVEHNVANVVVVGSNPITRFCESCQPSAFSRQPETWLMAEGCELIAFKVARAFGDQRARAVLLLARFSDCRRRLRRRLNMIVLRQSASERPPTAKAF